MIKLEETKEYQKLQAETRLYRLIYDLRVYSELLNGKPSNLDKNGLLTFIMSSDLLKRIYDMIECIRTNLIDVNTIQSSSLTGLALSLSSKKSPIEIGEIINEQERLMRCCPNMAPLPIELIEFVSATQNQLAQEYQIALRRKIQELLRIIPFKEDSQLTAYMTICPYVDYFSAYFLENFSVYEEAFPILLNTLLKNAPYSETIPARQLELLVGKAQPSEETIKCLLKPYVQVSKRKARITLKMLNELYSPIDFDIETYIKKRIVESYENGTGDIEWPNLFESLIAFTNPSHEWAKTFIESLFNLPNGQRHLKAVYSLLSAESKEIFAAEYSGISPEEASKPFVNTPKKSES